MPRVTNFCAFIALFTLIGCAEKDFILPGERESILPEASENTSEFQPGDESIPPLNLPATRANSSWTQGIASSITRTEHPELGAAPRVIWSVGIGSGDGRKNRITADPVVADGRVFTLDSAATVTAISTAGEVLWSRDLTPENES
ncbi:MAG: quinoprotein, partial [Pseudomonadota bacterium]